MMMMMKCNTFCYLTAISVMAVPVCQVVKFKCSEIRCYQLIKSSSHSVMYITLINIIFVHITLRLAHMVAKWHFSVFLIQQSWCILSHVVLWIVFFSTESKVFCQEWCGPGRVWLAWKGMWCAATLSSLVVFSVHLIMLDLSHSSSMPKPFKLL